jgi:hypothetical protein
MTCKNNFGADAPSQPIPVLKGRVSRINLLNCEGVTFASHDKTWLSDEFDDHLKRIDVPLDSFVLTAADEIKIAMINFEAGTLDVKPTAVSIDERRA